MMDTTFFQVHNKIFVYEPFMKNIFNRTSIEHISSMVKNDVNDNKFGFISHNRKYRINMKM